MPDIRPTRPNPLLRNRYVLLSDILLIPAVAAGAFALRFDWLIFDHRQAVLPFIVAALTLKPPIFLAFGLYRRYWRYATVRDLLVIVLGVTAAAGAMGVAGFAILLLKPELELSRVVVIIDWLLTLCAAGGVRLSVRILAESRDRAMEMPGAQGHVKRAVVVGAGNAGAMVVREMQRNPQLGVRAVGFLDDDLTKHGKQIYGVSVLGRVASLAHAVKSHGVDEVIIAMPTAPGNLLRSIAEECRTVGVSSRTIPGVFELLDGKVTVGRLRQIEIADLLRRSQVASSAASSAYLSGHTVLVTGAGGSIGFELCRQVAHSHPACLVMLGHGENSIFEAHAQLAVTHPGLRIVPVIADVRDHERILRVFQETKPSIVFHAAAHKHVPLMEMNPVEAVTNNVFGTKYVVDAAVRTGVARFVMISTDKAVSPSSVMGATKRLAELVVLDAARREKRAFAAVRFGNVLGSRGSVVPFFKRQIELGGPITVTHPEMKRFFMTIPEAVHLVLEAGGMTRGEELFVLRMGEPVAIVDLAKDLIKLSGFTEEEIPIVFTGVRAGEKLEELLWEDASQIAPTANPEILQVAAVQSSELIELPGTLRALAAAVADGRPGHVHATLMECLPTFVPGVRA